MIKKKINGETFFLSGFWNKSNDRSLAEAKKSAEEWRKIGYKARVVKVSDGYLLFTRKLFQSNKKKMSRKKHQRHT